MLLLTGPNFSGKSVYMKQVGFHIAWEVGSDIADHEKVALIVYLAHIGR
jgi:ABC-type iron transport system FetAB ATPase subunit